LRDTWYCSSGLFSEGEYVTGLGTTDYSDLCQFIRCFNNILQWLCKKN
jgi:hypothetical protein